MSRIGEKIVELALRELGVEEQAGSNCGPRVNEYKAATELDPKQSWAWCAAFVCWLVREALSALHIPETAGFHRPRTAGAWNFEDWSLAQDKTTQTKREPGEDIRRGDIVIFTFSHIGLAVEDAKGGFVDTVEGNTDAAGSREGGGVFRKKRPVNRVKARIRFTV